MLVFTACLVAATNPSTVPPMQMSTDTRLALSQSLMAGTNAYIHSNVQKSSFYVLVVLTSDSTSNSSDTLALTAAENE